MTEFMEGRGAEGEDGGTLSRGLHVVGSTRIWSLGLSGSRDFYLVSATPVSSLRVRESPFALTPCASLYPTSLPRVEKERVGIDRLRIKRKKADTRR